MLNFDYAKTAKAHKSSDSGRQDGQLGEFPIELARLRSSFYLLAVTTVATISYGWVVEQKVVRHRQPKIPHVFISFLNTARADY